MKLHKVDVYDDDDDDDDDDDRRSGKCSSACDR
jgi:hypothetical protein